MPLDQIINISVTNATGGVSQQGFGEALVLSCEAGRGGGRAAYANRVRHYGDPSAMLGDFLATDPTYLAAETYFGQTPKPTSLAVGRRALLSTATYEITVLAQANATIYKVSVGGVDISYTSDSSGTYAEIVAGLVTALNVAGPTPSAVFHGNPSSTTWGYKIVALGVGPFGTEVSAEGTVGSCAAALNGSDYNVVTWANVTGNTGYQVWRTTGGTGDPKLLATLAANTLTYTDNDSTAGTAGTLSARFIAAGSSPALTITAQSTGIFLPIHVYDPALLSLRTTHTDPGIATDIAACALEDATWYGVLGTYLSQKEIVGNDSVSGLAKWCQSNSKFLSVLTADTPCENDAVSGATDVGKLLVGLAYDHVMPLYNRTPAGFGDAGILGRIFPLIPGSYTAAFKTIAGCPVDTMTDTQQTNLEAKNLNYYGRWYGRNVYYPGVTSAGLFADGVIAIDYLKAKLAEGVALDFVNNDKIPFTDGGIAVLKGRCSGILNSFTDPKTGFIVDGSVVVTAPKAKDVSDADKAARHLTMTFTAEGAGAIQGFTLVGAITL